MSLMDRILRRKLTPSVSEEVARTVPGPLTANEAFQMALPIAEGIDKHAQLMLATSGTDLQSNGKAFVWEFLFNLDSRGSRLMLTFSPDPSAPDVDNAPVHLKKRVFPSDEKPFHPLPLSFRDSPEVVSELSEAGVDFVAGPTDMKLESGLSADGRPVWITYCWDKRYEASFQKSYD